MIQNRISLLPLAIIHQNNIFKKHILIVDGKKITLQPLQQECESTKFISAIIIIANKNALSFMNTFPLIGKTYSNLEDITSFLQNNNLYTINDEEPTLIIADSSGYHVLL